MIINSLYTHSFCQSMNKRHNNMHILLNLYSSQPEDMLSHNYKYNFRNFAYSIY